MKQEPYIEWDAENKVATCLLYYNNQVFYGSATCHPNDYDMVSEKTGEHIAYLRALIESLKYRRENELKPQLAVLNQLYYSMNRSKYFNPKSYETKMLFRRINAIKEDLKQTNLLITKYKLELQDFIEQKDIFYKKLREIRGRE